METPKRKPTTGVKQKECDMEISFSENDFLVLNKITIENNSIDCLDESPYLKSLKPIPPVFKLSRKRLQCETDSPKGKSNLSNNLFKSKFTSSSSPIVQVSKKWRSASYNPTSGISPMKFDLASPLKTIDSNIITKYMTSSTAGAANSSINGTDEFANDIIPEKSPNTPNSTPNIVPTSNLIHSNVNFHQWISDLFITQKIDQHPSTNLLGDYSKTHSLPLISGRHKDLKTIAPETLANLLNGDYQKSVNAFIIVDARYPYEYEGGHIDGALNIYHREDINKYFFGVEKPTLATDKNVILNTILKNSKQSLANSSHNHKINLKIIFHCEFSSERGPSMCRYLRKIDREINEYCYPNLYYPEIYLLHGGYKLFFEKFKNLCRPPTYLPMHSLDHKQDLIKFRVKSKSWNCERKWRVSNRN